MSVFDEMMKQYKDMSSLQDFAEAQHRTIIELTKKLSDSEEKRKQVERMLGTNLPTTSNSLIKPGVFEDHEENICRMELKKLHDLSMERTLTLEEAKKVELYTKLLLALDIAARKKEPKDITDVSTDELLAIVEMDINERTNK